MSRFRITVAGGDELDELELEPGEDLYVPITYKNADGSDRDMTGAAVTFRLINAATSVQVYSVSLANLALLRVAGATTAGWAFGNYKGQLWETALGGEVSSGEFRLRIA